MKPIILRYVTTGWRKWLRFVPSHLPKPQECELIKEEVEYDEYGLPTMELIDGRLVRNTDYSQAFREIYGRFNAGRTVGDAKKR